MKRFLFSLLCILSTTLFCANQQPPAGSVPICDIYSSLIETEAKQIAQLILLSKNDPQRKARYIGCVARALNTMASLLQSQHEALKQE